MKKECNVNSYIFPEIIFLLTSVNYSKITENLIFRENTVASLVIFKFLRIAGIWTQRSCKINFDLHIKSFKKKCFLQTNDFSSISSNNRHGCDKKKHGCYQVFSPIHRYVFGNLITGIVESFTLQIADLKQRVKVNHTLSEQFIKQMFNVDSPN